MLRKRNTLMRMVFSFFLPIMLIACTGFLENQGMRSTVPALTVVPTVGEPEKEFTCYGADFTPEQKVRIVMMVFPEIENVLGAKAEGLGLKTDKLGSFEVKSGFPGKEGVYPIRVYNEEGRLLATTLVVVKKKPPKKE